MDEMITLGVDESREILSSVIEKKGLAVMCYQSAGRWHFAKTCLTNLENGGLVVRNIRFRHRKHPINLSVNQPVGISFKYTYGKFIFDTTVTSIESSTDHEQPAAMTVAVPGHIDVLQRRSYRRVGVPASLKVGVLLWHRSKDRPDTDRRQTPLPQAVRGRLVNISAGGAQVVLDVGSGVYSNDSDGARHAAAVAKTLGFERKQFIGLRFTPMPYETPVLLNARLRNIVPSANGRSIRLGLQIIGLEASPEGRRTLCRLVGVVEHYHRLNQSGAAGKDTRQTASTNKAADAKANLEREPQPIRGKV